MQQSTDVVRDVAPAIQILIAGRGMIRVYDGGQWVGMASTYRLAQQVADQREQLKQRGSLH
ncbi:hypothetical protein [Pseudomonas sp. DSP3-2-2]|uniref:hypothetical protein n=1 Tax=unclassified Pseudomonas TaxID=196821 RepID=UPI003CE865DA